MQTNPRGDRLRGVRFGWIVCLLATPIEDSGRATQFKVCHDQIGRMHRGAIILCGGKSTRMGRDKAALPFGPESMLQRVVRLLNDVVPVENMVVVAAVGQSLPELPSEIVVTRDERPERGPLEGLAAGLRATPETVDAVYATSCDVPLLQPTFVRRMFDLLYDQVPPLPSPLPRGGREGTKPEYDIVVPRDGEFHHPLAAVYRRSVLPSVEKLLSADRLRLRYLFEEVRTREINVEDLRSVDPDLHTLKNLNAPDDYQAALRLAGFKG